MRTLTLLLVTALAAASSAAIGCTTAATDTSRLKNDSLTKCVPNQTLVCLCGLLEGTQTCTEEGKLTECVCPATDVDHTEPPPGPDPDPKPDPDPDPKPIKNTCGDGKVDPGEACDDGNRDDNDGCSASCLPDGAPAEADECPGQVLSLWKGTKLTLVGTTVGYSNGSEASCYPSTGSDRVYTIQPSVDGFMSVDAAFASGFNAVVEVRRGTCSLETAQVLCEDTVSRPFKRVIQVEKDKNYYLIVDGDSPTAKGAYTIDIELK